MGILDCVDNRAQSVNSAFAKRGKAVKQQAAAVGSGPDNARRAPARLVQRERSDRVGAIGLHTPWLGDLYHQLLTLPWWAFLLGLSGVYLGLMWRSRCFTCSA